MVKATDCLIDIGLALLIRDKSIALGLGAATGSSIGFRCRECEQPVRPHAGENPPAHFEHVTHNPQCTLSPGWN
jgi:hypothetical protein